MHARHSNPCHVELLLIIQLINIRQCIFPFTEMSPTSSTTAGLSSTLQSQSPTPQPPPAVSSSALQSPSPVPQPPPEVTSVVTSSTLQTNSPIPQQSSEGSSVVRTSPLPPTADGGIILVQGFSVIILTVVAGVVVVVGLVLIASALIACALRKRGQKSSTVAFKEAKGILYLRHN